MVERIVLIGFRATGKTSTGKALAKVLGWDFVDADEEIERAEGKTISEIVESSGWEAFRKLEREYLKRVPEFKRCVIALGGGAVLHDKEMEKIKDTSFVVWLKASPQEIAKRLSHDSKTSTQRPSLTGKSVSDEVEKVLRERLPLYQKFSHIEVDTTSASTEEVVSRILQLIKR